MELIVDNTSIVHEVEAAGFDEMHKHFPEPDQDYTPSDFLRQFGAVIAICLGLAVFAHLLVFVVGD
jgi:hypothetical protein